MNRRRSRRREDTWNKKIRCEVNQDMKARRVDVKETERQSRVKKKINK